MTVTLSSRAQRGILHFNDRLHYPARITYLQILKSSRPRRKGLAQSRPLPTKKGRLPRPDRDASLRVARQGEVILQCFHQRRSRSDALIATHRRDTSASNGSARLGPKTFFAAAGTLGPAVPFGCRQQSAVVRRRSARGFEASPLPALGHRRGIAVVAGVADARASDPWIEGVVGPLDSGLLAQAVLFTHTVPVTHLVRVAHLVLIARQHFDRRSNDGVIAPRRPRQIRPRVATVSTGRPS